MKTLLLGLLALSLGLGVPAQEHAALRICASTPNAGALVAAVGGDDVEVTVFAKSSQDPHFVRALPSFVKGLSEADALVVVGFELEIGWIPALIDQAKNPRVRPSAAGHIDLSNAIPAIPTAGRDRGAGDVHALGNPHYLVDPLSGMATLGLLSTRLGALLPERREAFAARAAALKATLGALLFGDELSGRLDPDKLGVLLVNDRLGGFLAEQGLGDALGGFAARFSKHRAARVVVDHDAWPYLLRTCGLRNAGCLEPFPGVVPSTRHLRELIEALQADPAKLLIHVPYFEPRPLEFVASECGLSTVLLAHQVGAVEGTGDYASFVRHNLGALADALDAGGDHDR